MLLATDERDTIIREKLGIVYLTTGNEHPYNVLKTLLTKWETLELLDQTLQRPFARFLSPMVASVLNIGNSNSRVCLLCDSTAA